MDLIKSFYDKAKNKNFNVTGLLLENNDVLTLGSDSKLIGRIFELVSFGVLNAICKENNWKLEETESQTVYPDFTIIMENNTKNIAYPYDQYIKHYVIGFVYDRVSGSRAGQVLHIGDKIYPPYKGVEYFMQEKYKIAGDKPGSGNTENIGSILTNNIEDFVQGKGSFAKLGNDVFENYWRGYPRYRVAVKQYTTLTQYLDLIKNL